MDTETGVLIKEKHMGTQVTILTDGTRSNGPVSRGLVDHPPILAVGNSFTFGDEVSDDATWPAQLEAETRRRVVNAGVFGYGLDQTILRAEQLVSVESPPSLLSASLLTIF